MARPPLPHGNAQEQSGSNTSDADCIPGLVSVIMAAYNCEVYVGEAVRSVLAQTYQNW